jgi:hypothetical protein
VLKKTPTTELARDEADIRALKRVFKRRGLDYRNPADWPRACALVLETQKPEQGAPTKWQWDGLLALGWAYEVVRKRRSPKTLRRAAALILEHYPEFKSIASGERALARRLPMAIQRHKAFMARYRESPRRPKGISVAFGKNGGIEISDDQ